MNLIELMIQAKKIAQANAPMDTGNLRYNSIHAYPLHNMNGFRVESRFTVAYYGTILDVYGAGRNKVHKGWWSDGVVHDVAGFIEGVQNGKEQTFNNLNAYVAKFAPDNPQRKKRFRKSMISDE